MSDPRAGAGGMDEIVREFLAESRELADKVERDLLGLEKTPGDGELLGAVFRCLHTIKGNSGFLGFARLQDLAHAAEGLLSLIREGRRSFTPEVASALLATTDALRRTLASIEANNTEDGGSADAARASLLRLAETDGGTSPPPTAPETGAEPRNVRAGGDPCIRVDVGLLDRLMNLVGELVLSRNRIVQVLAGHRDAALATVAQRLNHVTAELQEGIMKARMQPIRTVWNRFPRIVRDLAAACGKNVRLELEGEETELDRTILEAIGDPLTHLLRNAIDHGIEPPAERAARGKPGQGRISLRAFHEGGHVIIEFGDDGAGIDPARIRDKAVTSGLIGAEQAARLSDREAVNLVFLRGLSTAETVTRLSGRGVGMDVAKSNIERIGGTIDLQSSPGEGARILMKIPLTLAIVPALIVASGGSRYAIPRVHLLELVRLDAGQAREAIERVHDAPVYRLRGKLLPLVDLGRVLGDGAASGGETNMVVLQAEDRPFGLLVDAVNDMEEIVVKPLGKTVKDLDVFAGATILGDGRVALILDTPGLARRAGVVREAADPLRTSKPAKPEAPSTRPPSFLLVGDAGGARMALPLDRVSRLEEFPSPLIESAGDLDAIQYRGQILPLVRLAQALPERRREPRGPALAGESGKLQVVVCRQGTHPVGLVVERILDIAEERPAAERPGTRPGVRFCAVVQGKITEFLDLGRILDGRAPEEE